MNWTQTGSALRKRCHATQVYLPEINAFLLSGGSIERKKTNFVELYDGDTDSFIQLDGLPEARNRACAVYINETSAMLVGPGQNKSQRTLLYSVANRTWTWGPELDEYMKEPCAGLIMYPNGTKVTISKVESLLFFADLSIFYSCFLSKATVAKNRKEV